MFRKYDEDNPETYMADFDGIEVEFKILPLGLRDQYVEDLGKDGSYTEISERIGQVVASINGEPVETELKQLTHLSDFGNFRNFVIINSFLPEAVSKNSQPSPESSEQEKDEGATNPVETEDDSVSITQPI